MPTARPVPSGNEAFDPEFARVLRTADPGLALAGPLTFLPPPGASAAGWAQAWTDWRDQTLARVIAPAMALAVIHSGRGEAREIQALDLALNVSLPEDACQRSVATGAPLLRRLSAARGERWLAKLQRAAAAGQTPAHFPVVYAAQSVLFHLPLRLLLPGYAYWEWTAAIVARPPASGSPPKFSAEAAGLRSLVEASLSAHLFDAAPAANEA